MCKDFQACRVLYCSGGRKRLCRIKWKEEEEEDEKEEDEKDED